MRCHYDERVAQYRCTQSGEYVCLEHARMDIVSVGTRVRLPPLPVRRAVASDYAAIKEFALAYWGETQMECFDQSYDVLTLPAMLALCDAAVAGVLSFAVEQDRLNIVMLNVDPQYQGRRTARSLLAAVEAHAREERLSKLVVATTNDDLPALYLYQRWGFVLSEIKAGAVLEHHGHEELGFASIPVRDEIRLEKHLA